MDIGPGVAEGEFVEDADRPGVFLVNGADDLFRLFSALIEDKVQAVRLTFEVVKFLTHLPISLPHATGTRLCMSFFIYFFTGSAAEITKA